MNDSQTLVEAEQKVRANAEAQIQDEGARVEVVAAELEQKKIYWDYISEIGITGI